MIEKIFCWSVVCTPWYKGSIRNMTIEVVAKDRKEAELIIMNEAHKFFDQDMHYIWGEPIEGYKKI
jgi:hypothetical protein